MKKFRSLLTLLISAIILLFISSSNSIAKTKTDYEVKAKIIGVADPNYKEYTYVDIGKAQGIKQGDRFMVQGRYGKVMVEVVQPFQRMSAVRIVDSWLLQEGNSGKMMAASMYPKARVRKFKEKKIMLASKTTTGKKKKSLAVKVKAEAAAAPIPANNNQATVPALPGEPAMAPGNAEVPGMEAAPAMPGTETAPGMEAAPGMPGEAPGVAGAPATGSGLPGEEITGGDMGAAPGGEPALPGGDMGAAPGGEPALPGGDMGAAPGGEPALPGGDMGLPADPGAAAPSDSGLPPMDPGASAPSTDVPGGDIGMNPGDALPAMP